MHALYRFLRFVKEAAETMERIEGILKRNGLDPDTAYTDRGPYLGLEDETFVLVGETRDASVEHWFAKTLEDGSLQLEWGQYGDQVRVLVKNTELDDAWVEIRWLLPRGNAEIRTNQEEMPQGLISFTEMFPKSPEKLTREQAFEIVPGIITWFAKFPEIEE